MKKLFVLIVAATLVLLANHPLMAAEDWNVKDLSIEKPAPDFTLKDLDGKTYKLKDNRGKVVLVLFTTTWCPSCKAMIPYFKKIYERYRDKDFQFIAIYIQEPEKRVKAFAEDYDIPYTIILDPKGTTARDYGIYGVPTLVLVDREGTIMCRQCRSVEVMLESLLP